MATTTHEPASGPAATQADWPALMAQAQAGDRVAYEKLLIEISPMVRAIARQICRNPTDAEDVVQDVLLTVHSIRQTYDPNRPFGPWIAAIARRRAIDHLRRRGRAARTAQAFAQVHETFSSDAANMAEERSLGSLDFARVRTALGRLPAGQRQAVELLKLQELTLAEASVRTGISAGALKVAVHRAMKSLKNMIGDGNGNDEHR